MLSRLSGPDIVRMKALSARKDDQATRRPASTRSAPNTIIPTESPAAQIVTAPNGANDAPKAATSRSPTPFVWTTSGRPTSLRLPDQRRHTRRSFTSTAPATTPSPPLRS